MVSDASDSKSAVLRAVAKSCFLIIALRFFVVPVFAATSQLKPVLKAIDPSQAKMDKAPEPKKSTPGSLGGIQGKPVDKKGGVVPKSSMSFPAESMIPQFGKPLPAQTGGSPGARYGQGWGTDKPSRSATTGEVAGTTVEEKRLTRLEKKAFGCYYPNHDLPGRIEHLESEVFGKRFSGADVERIARLEKKLGVSGAFSQEAPLRSQQPGAASRPAYQPYSGSMRPVQPQTVQTSQLPDRAQMGQSQLISPAGGALSGQGLGWGSGQSSMGSAKAYAASPAQPAYSRPPAYAKPPASARLPGYPSPVRSQNQQPPSYGSYAGSQGESADFSRVVQAIPFDRKAGDYFNKITLSPGGTVARWRQFPIKISIPVESPTSWKNSLESGIKKWGQYVPTTIVGPNSLTDVQIQWVNHLPPRKLGITRVTAVRGNPSIIIFLLRPTYYLPAIPEKALKGIFLHEMGHALGIWGHSSDADDIMVYPEVTFTGGRKAGSSKIKFGTITPKDINTLKRIYQTPSLPASYTAPRPVDWD